MDENVQETPVLEIDKGIQTSIKESTNQKNGDEFGIQELRVTERKDGENGKEKD